MKPDLGSLKPVAVGKAVGGVRQNGSDLKAKGFASKFCLVDLTAEK